MNAGISIVICTYNGAERLPDTLWHIAKQQFSSPIPWELIVVDNKSEDGSAEVAVTEWRNAGSPSALSVIYQPTLGLTYARETAYDHAAYEFILLCDDDNWLHPHYVETAFQIMNEHPTVGMLGGNGEFVFEDGFPAWMQAYCLFAGGKQNSSTGMVSANLLYGAAAVVRKSAINQLRRNGFSPLLSDRKGTQLTSGGDHELCYALALAGYQMWYDERLTFKHFIKRERTSWNYYLNYIKESSLCFNVLEPYKILVNTGKTSLPHFYYYLFYSFLFHLKHFIPVATKEMFNRKRSGPAAANHLRYVNLKIILASHFKMKSMKNSFTHAVKFKQRLLQTANGHQHISASGVHS